MTTFTTTLALIASIAAPAKGAAHTAYVAFDPADDFAPASWTFACTCGKGGGVRGSERDARLAAAAHGCMGRKFVERAQLAN